MKKYAIGWVAFFIMFLVISPLVITTLVKAQSKDFEMIENKENTEKLYVDLYLSKKDEVISIELEEYVTGVLSGEMPASFEIEALKSGAIVARTKALYNMQKDHDSHPGDICDTIHCQVYLSEEDLLSLHSQQWIDNYYSKIKNAVKATDNKVIYYDGKIIDALYHSSSGGKTENSQDVFLSELPYLKSVDSPYEQDSKYNNDSVVISLSDVSNSINSKFDKNYTINDIKTMKVLSRTDGESAKEIKIKDDIYSGREIRETLNLRSSKIYINNVSSNDLELVVSGYGHGVGLSQYGSNGMAKQGYTSEEILNHYYSDIYIDSIVQ